MAPSPEGDSQAIAEFNAARKGKGARTITPRVLQRAADVYREHFDDRPVEKVAREFGVKERQASNYIKAARKAGYLPETTRGRKAR